MSAQKSDGLDAANDQPAKTITKNAADFIALVASHATAKNGLNILFVALVFQFVAMAWGVL